VEHFGEEIVSEDDFVKYFALSFSKEDFANQIAYSFDMVSSSSVDPETYDVNIVFPLNFLSEYKENISSNFSSVFFNVLPKCSEALDVEYCVPENFDLEMFNNEIERDFERYFYNAFPDEFSIVWHVGESYSGTLADVYLKMRFYIYSFASLILLSLLVLISLILFKPFSLIVKWISVLLFVSSGLSIFLFSFFEKSSLFKNLLATFFSANSMASFLQGFFLDRFFVSFFFSLLPISLFSIIIFTIFIIKDLKNGKL
jgi:hypothetical protein